MKLFPYLVAAVVIFPVSAAMAQSSSEQKTPSTVDRPAEQRPGVPQAPKTTGAMDDAVEGRATSAQDVQAQTQGQPTAAQAGKGETADNPRPDITQHSPGTVGASPGAQPDGQTQKR